MSLLWAVAALTPEQHEGLAEIDALPGDADRPDMASGEPVKRLMAKYHITQHKYSPFDSEIYPHRQHGEVEHDLDDELHTRQQHLWKPALKEYLVHGHAHLSDPDYGDEDPVSYQPSTFEVGGRTWIDEGHHRILASRMRGESVVAQHGSANDDDSDVDYDEED